MRFFKEDTPLIVSLLNNDVWSAEFLLKNGADWLYSGKQKTTPFAVIHRKKFKSLIQILKEYVSTKRFKELEIKNRSLEGNFVDLRESAVPKIVDIIDEVQTVQKEGKIGASCHSFPKQQPIAPETHVNKLTNKTTKCRPADSQIISNFRIDPLSIEKLEIHQQIREKRNQMTITQKAN